MRADGLNIWNSTIQRNFRIREGLQFQLRGDALNVFNRSSFAAPDVNPFSTNFGRVTGTSGQVTKRWIQLQARIVF